MPEIITSPAFRATPGIRHGFFTREWGDMGLSRPEVLEENIQHRAKVATEIGVAAPNLISGHQIHSPDVITVQNVWAYDQRPQADAMVTNQKNIALGILTADCVPILFADPKTGVIAGAHAGWRGALSGIIENTLAAMENLGAQRSDIIAAIGACIWQKSYEVGPEFPAPFLAQHKTYQKFFQPSARPDHYMFDLPAYVENRLKQAGIENISPSPADTCADEKRFYSYRRNTLSGIKRAESLISVIVITG